jgi:uncharacterized cupin superfamily protein
MLRELLRDLRHELVLKVHGSGSEVRANSPLELMDSPICRDWIDEGAPQARASCAIRSADGRIASGEWTCTTGRFHWTYYEDEVIRILEGEAFIEVDGAFRRFGPGDTVFFPLGQTVRWYVPKFVRKAFVLARPGNTVDFLRTFSLRNFLGIARSPETSPETSPAIEGSDGPSLLAS